MANYPVFVSARNIKDQEEYYTVTFREDVKGWVSFKSFFPENAISMANDYYTFNNGELYIHHVDREGYNNHFYISSKSALLPTTLSSYITVIINDDPGTIKAFNTLNYEGSQSKIEKFKSESKTLYDQDLTVYNDQDIYNLNYKAGWYVEKIFTDKEEGDVPEFIEKEGKWFNNINRFIEIGDNENPVDLYENLKTADFTFQGIGQQADIDTTNAIPIVSGCMDPQAFNYNPLAIVDDGSCIPKVYGCTDFTALNYNASANTDDGSCIANPQAPGPSGPTTRLIVPPTIPPPLVPPIPDSPTPDPQVDVPQIPDPRVPVIQVLDTRIIDEEVRIIEDERRITEDERRITEEERRITEEARRVREEEETQTDIY